MKQQGIYIFKNIKNNKVYIGSSLNLDKRNYEHRRLLNLGKHENKHFQNAWNKYGEDAFEYEILENIPIIDNVEENNRNLRNIETKYIQEYKSYNPEFGYNFIPGGIGTSGLICSEEKKCKISEANKGKVAYNRGVAMSESQKQLLRKMASEDRGKSIDIYTISGEFIETVPSIREVNRKYGVGRNTITDCCKNLTNPIKYIFRYHGEPLDTVGSKKITSKTKEELELQAKHYREIRGKKIDIYSNLGEFIETLPAIIAIHEKYNLSESTIRKGLQTKGISGGYIFRYSGEPLGDVISIITSYNSKASKISNLYFIVYKNNTIVDVLKYKKDVEEKYSVYRGKSKLQKLLKSCTKCGDSFEYNNYLIKLDIAPDDSNIISELRQLDKDVIEGTNNSANGEA